MLTENKISKYLIYAIGEIVLVVIGILIAVQINNWNNQKELTKNNEILLKKLIEELNLNKERLNLLAFVDNKKWDGSIKGVVKNCDSLLKLTVNGLKEENLNFIMQAEFHAGSSQLSLYEDTYDELLNTGKLYKLGSDSVIVAIKNYYKRYEREIEYKQRSGEYALQGITYMENTRGILKINYELNPSQFKLSDYPWYFDEKSQGYIDFQKGIKRLYDAQNQDLKKCIELIEYTDKLIAVLENELSLSYN